MNWWIKKSRKFAGITQQVLADMSGVPLPTIKTIELSNKEPSQEQIDKIAKALDVEITDISQKACTDSAIKAAKEIKAVAFQCKFEFERLFNLSNCINKQ